MKRSHLVIGRLALIAVVLVACACNPARGIPVFLWHSVGEGTSGDYDVPAEEFDRELAMIKAHGATVITLDQLFDARYQGGELPKKSVVLTFDDGLACLYRAAMPVLKKHKMVAEVFVVGAFTAEDEAHRVVHHDKHGAHPYLIWPELIEMNRSGVFKIQSHSMTHRKHTQLSEAEKYAELADSKRLLSQRLGVPINFYAYPYGGFSTFYRDQTEKVGYRGALAVQKGIGTRYGMLRESIHRGSEKQFSQILERYFGPLK